MKKILKLIWGIIIILSCTFFIPYNINYVYADNTPPSTTYYTVTLLVDGEEYKMENNQCSNYNDLELPTPTKEGFTFNYWIDQDGKKYTIFVGSGYCVKNLTLTAVWIENSDNIYKLIYNTNGGNNIANDTIGSNKCVALPIPEKEGYVFNYWSGSDGLIYHNGDKVCKNYDLTLTANWQVDIDNLYNLTFNTDGVIQ